MNKLLNILDESYNPNIYQVECRVVMSADNRAIPEIISDIRAIPGITTVNTINSDYNTEEGRHVIDLSIKVDPSPFNPFDKSSFEKILNDMKKLPDIRGAKFISSPIIAENRLQKLIKEVLQEKKEDRCKRIADRRYNKPSAYKSGAVVRCRQGDIWKGIKEADDLTIKNSYIDEDGDLDFEQIQNDLIKTKPYYKSLLPNYLNDTLLTDSQINQLIELFVDNESDIFDADWMTDTDKIKFNQRWRKADIDDLSDWFVRYVEGLSDNWDELELNEKKLKETDNPQSGKAAPYGSGYAKLKDIIKEIIQEDESLHKWFKRKDPSGEETSCDLGYKKLNEVGEANLTPYKWEEEDVDGYWTYVEFTTDEGTEYNVALEVMNYTPKNSTSYVKALNIEFAVTVKDAGDYSYSTTNVIMNKGELYRVMSTIAAIVKHYVKKYKIQAIIYSPSKKTGEEFGTQRNNLYKAFISKAIQGVEFQQKGNMVVAILPNNTIQKEGKALPYDSGYSELKEIIKEIIQEDESLHKWFKRKGPSGKEGGWVDCNTCRKVNGKTKCKSCGRKKGEKRDKYPSCRPTPSQCKSPGKGKKWGKTK